MADTGDNFPQDLAAEALQLTVTEGLDAGCQLIEAAGDPIMVASAYKDFSQVLYRQNKDVQHMIDAGRRGIRFALDHAARIESDDAETTARLKKIARMIAFNVGANSWPGWGDDGVEISPDQRQAGSEAATLSLRLVNELNLGPSQIGKAHWLVGAHHIAARRPEAALASLDEAARAFASAADGPAELMARGYCALARKLCLATRAAAMAELDQVLQRLGQEGSKAATFYQRQIAVADRILGAGPEDQ
jgi:hypothetical protein